MHPATTRPQPRPEPPPEPADAAGPVSIADWLPRFAADGRWQRAPAPARAATPEAYRAALTRLPRSHRDPVVLCDVAGWDVARAASRLGASVPDTARRLHEARLVLRALMAAAESA